MDTKGVKNMADASRQKVVRFQQPEFSYRSRNRRRSQNSRPDGLKPLRLDEGRYQFLIFAQEAVVRRAEHVVDTDAVLGERKQSTPIQHARPTKRRSPLDHQAASLR